jgi:hypothetical protein
MTKNNDTTLLDILECEDYEFITLGNVTINYEDK